MRAMTFKTRKGRTAETAAFTAWIDLTREEVAIAEKLATDSGAASSRIWLRRVATEAVKAQIEAARKSKAS